MRIYITGASGFLGRAVTKKLISEGIKLTALSLPGDPWQPPEGVSIANGDITDAGSLKGLAAGSDAILHLAGAVGYGVSWDACRALNVLGTENIAAEALNSGVRRFIHMSSVSVYGRVADAPITEDFPLKKIGDPYGDTKIEAEILLQNMADQNRIDLTIIRPTMVYGPGDMLFFPKVEENLKSGSARIIGAGTNRVDAVHIDDVADFVCLAVQKPESVGRVYNLNNPDNPSWKEMLEEMARALGESAPDKKLAYNVAIVVAGFMELVSALTRKPPRLTRYAVRNVGRSYNYVTDRMSRELGFKPTRDMLQYIRENFNLQEQS